MVRISFFIYVLFSSFSVITFFLPLHLMNRGLTSEQIGTIFALGALVSIFGQSMWGYLSDKTKTIKRIIQLLLISCFCLSIGLFSVKTFMAILFFYLLFMAFNCSAGPLTETLCLAYAYENKKPFGKMRLWGEAGVGTSSLLLGIIVQHTGIHSLWFIYGVILLFSIGISFILKDTKTASTKVNLSALRNVMTQRKLLWFLFLILIIAIPHRMNDSMLSIYMNHLKATKTQLGLAWTVATLSDVPTLLFSGYILRKGGEIGVFITASFIYTVRWAIYSQASNPDVLIFSQLLHGLTYPLLLVSSLQYILSIVPPELRATGQAAFAITFGGVAGIIGNVGGGFIIGQFGPHAAYEAGSILALIGSIAAIFTYVKDKRNIIKSSHSFETNIK